MAQYRPKSIEELLSGSSAGAGVGTGLLSALRSYSSIVDSFARRDYYSTLAEDKSEKYAIDKINSMLTASKDLRNINDPAFWDTFATGLESMKNVTLTPAIDERVRYGSKMLKQARTRVSIGDDFRDFANEVMGPGGQLTLEYNMGLNDDAKEGKKGSSKLLYGDKTNPYNYGGVPNILEYGRQKFNAIRDTGYVDKVTQDMFDDLMLHGKSLKILGFQDEVIEDNFPKRPLIEAEWNKFIASKETNRPYMVQAENITGNYRKRKELYSSDIEAQRNKIMAQTNIYSSADTKLRTHMALEAGMWYGTEKEYKDETEALQLFADTEFTELRNLNTAMKLLKAEEKKFFPLLDIDDAEKYDWRDMIYSLTDEEVDQFTTFDAIDKSEGHIPTKEEQALAKVQAATKLAEDQAAAKALIDAKAKADALALEKLNEQDDDDDDEEEVNTYTGIDGQEHIFHDDSTVVDADSLANQVNNVLGGGSGDEDEDEGDETVVNLDNYDYHKNKDSGRYVYIDKNTQTVVDEKSMPYQSLETQRKFTKPLSTTQKRNIKSKENNIKSIVMNKKYTDDIKIQKVSVLMDDIKGLMGLEKADKYNDEEELKKYFELTTNEAWVEYFKNKT